MKFCYVYYDDTLFPTAQAALPSNTTYLYTGPAEDDFAYCRAVQSVWNKGDDLVIIEQDIIIHDDVINQLENCKSDWCSFTMPMRGGALLDSGWGCIKISAPLQARYEIPLTHRVFPGMDGMWNHMVDPMKPCVHRPPVGHLHYVPCDQGKCVCEAGRVQGRPCW